MLFCERRWNGLLAPRVYVNRWSVRERLGETGESIYSEIQVDGELLPHRLARAAGRGIRAGGGGNTQPRGFYVLYYRIHEHRRLLSRPCFWRYISEKKKKKKLIFRTDGQLDLKIEKKKRKLISTFFLFYMISLSFFIKRKERKYVLLGGANRLWPKVTSGKIRIIITLLT